MELLQSGDVFAQLSTPSFQRFWDRLYEECPWKTGFQSRFFVHSWYEHYRSTFEPVVIFSQDPNAPGLLPLAKCGSKIVVAGAHQCEYQGWLALQLNGNSFIESALILIAGNLDAHFISFRYVSPGTPIEWAMRTRGQSWSCEWKEHSRPIIRLGDATQVAEYLQKKKSRRSTKNYLNRLKRIGELRLERIVDAQQLALVFDRLISFYDTRQGAANNSVPFQEDANKKAFHLSLLQCPGLLHISVLKAGDELVSALFGMADGKTYSLAMPMFSPVHADNSPIALHLMMLVERLHREGFSVLDLTPGGDPFKERFANDHDCVGTLAIYFRRRDWVKRRIALAGTGVAKRCYQLLRADPAFLRRGWTRVRRVPITAWPSVLARKLSLLAEWISSTLELRIYALDKEAASRFQSAMLMSRDNLADLLAFQPKETWQTLQEFLSESLKNIGAGHHFYTRVENGGLKHYGWLIENQKVNVFPEVGQEYEFPPGSAVLYNFYTDPEARGKGLYKEALRQMLLDAAQIREVSQIYIAVMAGNKPSRHVIEKLGFVYQCSLFHARRMGKSRKWSSAAVPAGSPINTKTI